MKPREEFLSLLETSRKVAWDVAAFLHTKGYDVRILPATTTPDDESRFEHSDEGDLEIRQRIEIKHWPNIDFKSVDDIPYPRIIVDSAHIIEKHHATTLFAYMIVNASRTGAIFIPAWTRQHWVKEKRYDRREKRYNDFYLISKDLVTYMSLQESAGWKQ